LIAALRRSLQARLMMLVLAAVTLSWLCVAVATWFDARHEVDELLDGHLAQAAALLIAQQAAAPDTEHGEDAPILHHYAPRVAFQIFRGDRLVLRSANAARWPPRAGEKIGQGLSTATMDGKAWRLFAVADEQHGLRVYVGERLSSRTEVLVAVMRSMLLPMIVALPLLGVAAGWAIRRGIEPLRGLRDRLAQRRAQDIRPFELADAPTEVMPVIDALNGLLRRIGLLLDAERRFTADAAHELRTPIAAICAQAQVAMGEADDARRRHALRATLHGCDRAARLIGQLLTLSRLEAGESPGQAEVDLASLTREVVAGMVPAAIVRQQQLSFEGGRGCTVAGNEALLAVLVRNLVDNALRYSPPRASIDVGVSRQADRVTLQVQDSGAGLPEPLMQRLGERFFRPPGQDESGSGLGWSIAQRVAAAHGARLHAARSAALGGLAVSVEFPAVLPAALPAARSDTRAEALASRS
jgi:two-component system sensor histidine kinase QseC